MTRDASPRFGRASSIRSFSLHGIAISPLEVKLPKQTTLGALQLFRRRRCREVQMWSIRAGHTVKTFFLGIFPHKLGRERTRILLWARRASAAAVRRQCRWLCCAAPARRDAEKPSPNFQARHVFSRHSHTRPWPKARLLIIPRGHSGPAMSFYAYNNRAMQHFRDRSGNCEKSWPNPTAVDSLIRCDVHNFQR